MLKQDIILLGDYMKIAVLGAGAYGLALAQMIDVNKNEVVIWTKFDEEKKMLEKEHANLKALPGIKLKDEFQYTTNMQEAVTGARLILIAVPAGFVDDISRELKRYITKDQHICLGSKGIEQGTCLFVTDVLKKYIKTSHIAVISGPSFAIDIANKVPIGLSIGTKNKETLNIVKEVLENDTLKLRATKDILGIEICGSIKNVIAIASGMIAGMNLPESTQAMFITESLNDIKNLIRALGGSKKTILSFAGFGDILLTCTSKKSRNFTLGYLIGSKRPKEEIEAYKATTTIEGLYTLKSIYKLLNNKKVNMPIINLIYDIIFKNKEPNLLLKFLIEK